MGVVIAYGIMTQKHTNILCIGSVLWDIIGRCDEIMAHGDDRPGQITRIPGGVAMNVAMALKAYGLQPILLSAVGRDADGSALMQTCSSLGMVTEHIFRPNDLPTDRYMAIEGKNGLSAAVADVRSLEASGDRILRPLYDGALNDWRGIIALDGNLTKELLAQIADDALFQDRDIRLAPASPGKADRMRCFLNHPSTTLYVNLCEASLILERSFQNSYDAARALIEGGLHRAVVTDGANCVTAASVSRGNAKRVDAEHEGLLRVTPPQVKVIRVTGAGDTFMAAHIAAEAQRATPELALQRAAEAAARYVSGDSY